MTDTNVEEVVTPVVETEATDTPETAEDTTVTSEEEVAA